MTPRMINEKAAEIALAVYAKPARMADDMVIEAVGNDEWKCADAIRDLLLNEDRDNWPEMIAALKAAFLDYTLTDNVYEAAETLLAYEEAA